MNEAELIRIQEWRSSVKKFDADKKIPATAWDALEKSLVLSPSSYGLQPWKFLIVTSAAVKKQLRPLSWGQSQVEECSHFVVFARRNSVDVAYVEKFIHSIVETRAIPAAKVEGYKAAILSDVVNGARSAVAPEWAARQVYIALGNFMTSAAALGIDTCPMEGIDPPKFDEVLGLKGTDYSTVVACAAGYRHAEDVYSKLKKVRFPTKDLIKHV